VRVNFKKKKKEKKRKEKKKKKKYFEPLEYQRSLEFETHGGQQ
jgi:hypothetical protein